MLIPAIDLKDGRVVQLVQGEKLALATDDLDGWMAKFARYPRVQVIDLDGALGSGDNAALVARICRTLPCRVGGGIRTIARAQAVLDLGAHAVIVSSALFRGGRPDLAFAASLAEAIGPERIIAAIDSKAGRVVIRGWTEATRIDAADAARALEPFCGEFLYTHVDTEGLMQGIPMEAVARVRGATTHRLTAAGGITTQAEIDALDAMGVDSVVGMAVYTGRLQLG